MTRTAKKWRPGQHPLTRRRWLSGAGSMGVAAAGLGLCGPARSPLAAMLAAPQTMRRNERRLLVVYVPDGCIPSRWHPTGTTHDFSLPDMSAPLEAIREHCVFLHGLDMYAGGLTHEGGIRKVLTATHDLSLDVHLGDALGKDTAFSSLQLGVGATFKSGSGGMSFVGAGQELAPEDNPIAGFERLFANNDSSDPAAELRLRQDRSLIDASLGDVLALQKQLGSTERAKLDIHLDSLREIERRLAGGGDSTCSSVVFNEEGFTVDPKDYYPKTYHIETNFDLVGKLQMDLMTLALSCNLTRFGTLMWSHPVSPTRIPEAGTEVANHDASHCGSAQGPVADAFVMLKHWFLERFIQLVQHMKSVPDGDGNLLDNTLILLCSEIGDSNLHNHVSVPFVLVNGGKVLETNRFLDYAGKGPDGDNEPHAKLLVSLANAMGSDIDSFGYVGHGKGGLEGLLS